MPDRAVRPLRVAGRRIGRHEWLSMPDVGRVRNRRQTQVPAELILLSQADLEAPEVHHVHCAVG
jgi:hypothetical protein